MPLEKGKPYTWTEILDVLDADDTPPPFALHQGDRVLGLALNRWQNPLAPAEVLVGCGSHRQKYAEAFIVQQPVVPVLIKENRDDSVWKCFGNFKLSRVSDEPADKNARVRWPDIPDIYKILFLEAVKA